MVSQAKGGACGGDPPGFGQCVELFALELKKGISVVFDDEMDVFALAVRASPVPKGPWRLTLR